MALLSSLLGVGALGLLLALLLSPELRGAPSFLRRAARLPRTLVAPEEKLPDAVRVGILGASFIAQVAVVYAAGKRNDVVAAAVAARDPTRAHAYAAEHGIPRVFSGDGAYGELLRSEDVDAVYIGLPTQMHRHWVLEALAAGKHVLVEKPAALSEEDVAEMWAAAKSAGLVLMEAAHHRYHPAAIRARGLLESGEVGNITHITSRFVMVDPMAALRSALPALFSAPSGQRAKERIKNFDRWWYCVDALLWASQAASAKVLQAEQGRYSVSAELELEVSPGSAVTATIEMARDRLWPLFDWSITAHGTQGVVRFSNVGYPFLWHALVVDGLQARREQHYGNGETTFEHQLGQFAAAVRSMGLPTGPGLNPSLADGALAAAVQRVASDIVASLGEGPL